MPYNFKTPGINPNIKRGGLLGTPTVEGMKGRGLFDFKSNDDLLHLGLGMLEASGPSREPVSLGQSMNRGFQNMMNHRQRKSQQDMQNQQFEMQKAEHEMRMQQHQNPERKIIKGGDGYQYYQDNGERVLPNVQQQVKPNYGSTVTDNFGRPYLINKDTQSLEAVNLPEGFTPKEKSPLGTVTLPDGTTFAVGGGLLGMGTKAQNDVENKAFTTGEGLSRLYSIRDQFKTKYQELPYRLESEANAWKEKLGFKLGGKDKKELQSYSTFKRDAISNLNQYIREITGAQMSEHEADRITKGVANPGQGLFDGDSPSQFDAKLNSSIGELEAANLRYQYLLQRGSLVQGDKFTAALSQRYPLSVFVEAKSAINAGAKPEDVYNRITESQGGA